MLTGIDESLGAENIMIMFIPFAVELVSKNRSLRRVSVPHIAMPFTEDLR